VTAGVVLPFLALAIYGGPRWLALVLALLAVCGARELVRIHRAKGPATSAWLPAAGAVLLIASQARLIPIGLPAALVAITVSAMVVELFRRHGSMLAGFPLVLLASIYVGLLPAYILRFYDLGGGGGSSPWPVYWVLILIFACDTAAYVVGSNFGRHKLWPRVSPSKSWEGSIAGVITSVALAVGLVRMVPELSLPSRIVAGLLVGVFAQIGDLGESLMKREAAMKDSGTTFPGHGGVLDRLDSVVLAVPILYYWLLWSLRAKG
jgi:phosphatidate cytidylyltransferase